MSDITAHTPITSIEGIGWPAAPTPRVAAMLAIAYQLDQSQWWSPERLLAHQLRQLQGLIDHAIRTAPFYRDWLAEAARVPPGNLTMDVWQRIPILRRSDVQRAGLTLLSAAPPKSHGAVKISTTSGSTGEPLSVHRLQVETLFHQALTLRYHTWHRRALTADSLVIRTVSNKEGLSKPHAWVPGYRTGPQRSLDISRPIPELFDEVLAADPIYLQTHPSTLDGLLRLSRETGRRPTRLREARTFGEVLDDRLRQLCAEVWEVPVTDNYTAEEFGILALQCPAHQHLHVQSENALVEVLDDNGAAVAPGGVGRLVVSGLRNFAQPLIRYEIGDLAEVGAPCRCGRGLPVLTRILGRVRNLVVLPSGARRHPVLNEARILATAPVTQYQLVQTSREEIEVRLVTLRPLDEAEETALGQCFSEGFGHAFTYRFTYQDALLRTARGKFEIFRSNVQT